MCHKLESGLGTIQATWFETKHRTYLWCPSNFDFVVAKNESSTGNAYSALKQSPSQTATIYSDTKTNITTRIPQLPHSQAMVLVFVSTLASSPGRHGTRLAISTPEC